MTTAPLFVTNRRLTGTIIRRLSGLPPSVVVSLLVLLVILAWALFPSWFTSSSPVVGDTGDKLQPPSGEYLFGTDHLGRDILTRVIYGTAASVTSALLAVGIGLVIGTLIGLVAGYIGGWTDSVLSRFVDVLLAIPGFLLALVIVSSLGFKTVNAAIAVGVLAVASFARVSRSEVIKIRKSTFVEAASLQGGNRVQILIGHIAPNAYRSVLALAVLEFGSAILAISGLAFLGYGDAPPSSDWGLLISEGRNYYSAPWFVLAPSIVIVATVLSINRISRWIRRTN